MAYISFLNHCYIDTEVEMKEIYTSSHMWTLFENFIIDLALVFTDLFVMHAFLTGLPLTSSLMFVLCCSIFRFADECQLLLC